MRLATFNILHGRRAHDGAVNLERLAYCIRRLDPDVPALHELDHDRTRSSIRQSPGKC